MFCRWTHNTTYYSMQTDWTHNLCECTTCAGVSCTFSVLSPCDVAQQLALQLAPVLEAQATTAVATTTPSLEVLIPTKAPLELALEPAIFHLGEHEYVIVTNYTTKYAVEWQLPSPAPSSIMLKVHKHIFRSTTKYSNRPADTIMPKSLPTSVSRGKSTTHLAALPIFKAMVMWSTQRAQHQRYLDANSTHTIS